MTHSQQCSVGPKRTVVRRLLFCLPLFLIFIPDSSSREPVSPTNFRPVADNGATLPSQGEMERLAGTIPSPSSQLASTATTGR
jgi:hypothetical protein